MMSDIKPDIKKSPPVPPGGFFVSAMNNLFYRWVLYAVYWWIVLFGETAS